MMGFRKTRILAVSIMLLFVWSPACADAQEQDGARPGASELEIALAGAATDPLVEVFLPPAGSPDRVRCTRSGLLIQQRADVAGRPTSAAGFKTLLLAGGDFTVTFDFKCLRLDEPTEGWGQGLAFSVYLDDEQQTKLCLVLMSRPGRGQVCQVEFASRHGDVRPIYRPHHGAPFKEGSFIIARTGEEVTFMVDDGQERRLLETFPCSNADVSSVEAACTRLEKGNTPAEYLLERLHVKADRFFAFQTPKRSWFSWWKVLVATQVVLIGGLLFVLARRRNR